MVQDGYGIGNAVVGLFSYKSCKYYMVFEWVWMKKNVCLECPQYKK